LYLDGQQRPSAGRLATRTGCRISVEASAERFSLPSAVFLANNRSQAGEASMAMIEDGSLPKVLKEMRSRLLFTMHLDVRNQLIVGGAAGAFRRVGIVPGGTFRGARLSGSVLDGGSDWQTVRSDGSTLLDARLVLKTDDDALITMIYQGIRHGPADVIVRIDKGETVDPESYYFRINPLFETAAPKYEWINRVVAIGIGHRQADGPIYSVFEIL